VNNNARNRERLPNKSEKTPPKADQKNNDLPEPSCQSRNLKIATEEIY